jgi:myo-inositol-1(or 4)-monophosphatase
VPYHLATAHQDGLATPIRSIFTPPLRSHVDDYSRETKYRIRGFSGCQSYVDFARPAWQTGPVDAYESAARIAVAHAGAIIQRRRDDRGAVERKSTAIDFVTDVDRACEAAILDVLRSAFPQHAILAEESGRSGDDEFVWLVDPLDGTTNFAHGYPQVSVSVALHRSGQALLGLVYDPFRDELFVGRRGGGATLNDRPLAVSTRSPLESTLLASGFPYDRREHADLYLSYFKAFMMRAQGIRRAGSAALDLCWVAAGRVDGFWEWKLKPWDTAAGALIVAEAGGRVSDFAGNPFDPFGEQTLASNGAIHDEMIAVIADIP